VGQIQKLERFQVLKIDVQWIFQPIAMT